MDTINQTPASETDEAMAILQQNYADSTEVEVLRQAIRDRNAIIDGYLAELGQLRGAVRRLNEKLRVYETTLEDIANRTGTHQEYRRAASYALASCRDD
jgi:hypothetical protein